MLRELNALSDLGLASIELFRLFPSDETAVHPDAQRLMDRLHRERPLRGLAAFAALLLRRPRVSLPTLAWLTRAYWRQPKLLLRSWAAIIIASDHLGAMRRSGVSHVHAHFAGPPGIAARFVAQILRVPYSVTTHAYDLYVDQTVLPEIVRDAAFTTTISEYNREFIRSHVADPGNLYVIHCGVDSSRFAGLPRARNSAANPCILCVASLKTYKGHAVLLEALARSQGLGDAQIRLVGSGPLRDDLEKRATELGIADRVQFLGDRSEDEVVLELAQADVFVLPSIVAPDGRMDGIPVALMEAMAAGVPVIASRLSGIPELVEDGVSGLLVEPGDPQALAEALEAALGGGEAAARRATVARQVVAADFSVEHSARQLGDLLRESASRRRDG